MRLLIMSLFVGFLAACGPTEQTPELPPIQSNRISMDVGDLTTATFRYNPNKGEKWTAGSFDEAILLVVFDTDYDEADARGPMSQKGVMAMKFEALSPGLTSIMFEKTALGGEIIERRRLDFKVTL